MNRVRLVIGLALGAWIGRWAVLELASFLVRRRPRGPSPLESERIPGLMPTRRELHRPNE
jgi:hypothetical protein